MSAERIYRYDPKTAFLPGLASSTLSISLAISALIQQNEMKIVLAALSSLAFVGFLGLLPIVADPRVQLRVNASGLTYLPFSPDLIPWNKVKAIAIVRTTHRLGRTLSLLWKETIVREAINFDVIDATHFARGQTLYRLSARLSNLGPAPTFPIEISFLRGANHCRPDAANLAHEIGQYWKGAVHTFEKGSKI